MLVWECPSQEDQHGQSFRCQELTSILIRTMADEALLPESTSIWAPFENPQIDLSPIPGHAGLASYVQKSCQSSYA